MIHEIKQHYKMLQEIYYNLLGREPDHDGIYIYLPRFKNMSTKQAIHTITNDILQSDEYKVKKNKNIHKLRNQSNLELLKNYSLVNGNKPKNYNRDTIKIVIYTPPQDILCGGIMVLHNLITKIKSLQDPQIECYIYYWDHTEHKNDFCNDFFNPFCVDDNTIVIYPEIIKGNPLNAKHVIRWILLDIGIDTQIDTVQTWGVNDLVYHWEPPKSRFGKQLVSIWHNPQIFTDSTNQNGERPHSCYALKKIKNTQDKLHKRLIAMHTKDSICIDDMDINNTIKVFDSSNIFYCYDPNSFLAIMAPLRGCLTVLHTIFGISKEQYYKERMIYKNGFYLDAGIAYGLNAQEIERAKKTLTNIHKDLETLTNLYNNDINNFIMDIKNLLIFNNIPNNTVKNIYDI